MKLGAKMAAFTSSCICKSLGNPYDITISRENPGNNVCVYGYVCMIQLLKVLIYCCPVLQCSPFHCRSGTRGHAACCGSHRARTSSPGTWTESRINPSAARLHIQWQRHFWIAQRPISPDFFTHKIFTHAKSGIQDEWWTVIICELGIERQLGIGCNKEEVHMTTFQSGWHEACAHGVRQKHNREREGEGKRKRGERQRGGVRERDREREREREKKESEHEQTGQHGHWQRFE